MSMKPFVLNVNAFTYAVCMAGMISVTGCVSTPVIDAGAQWEEVSRAGMLFGEGVVADKSGMVYSSDITNTAAIKENNPGGIIWRFDPRTGQAERFLQPSGMSNGLNIDKNGDLLIGQGSDGGGRGVMRMNLATRALSPVAKTFNGKQFNAVNDVVSDAQGRIYFTDVRINGNDFMELPNSVYRVDPNGTITEIGRAHV